MTGRQWTLLGLAMAGSLLAISEANALADSEEGDTISAIAHGAITTYPVLAGLLAAPLVHFCTPTRRPGEPLPLWQGAGVAIVGGACLGLAWARYDRSKPTGVAA